jgi:hypothetical protein
MMKGFFGDLFDFNHDGNLDGAERAADFALFDSLMEDDEKKAESQQVNAIDDGKVGEIYEKHFNKRHHKGRKNCHHP